jgi:sigma-B regulation protein RsbU (phosphoserine phosphatase)
MPRLSGVELVRRVRKATSEPGAGFAYVIMLTGRNEKADLVGGIEAGADDFVCKPFDREELRVRLLAGERIVTLERALQKQNAELREAGDRMRRDLAAAARVQRAMLPKQGVRTAGLSCAWIYVPTDQLAGDAIGLEMLDERWLLAYVADVSGHGVPAALLSVTVMHAMSPSADGALLGSAGGTRSLGPALTELNRRFCATDNDGRFVTMMLCVLDTVEGVLTYASAGHPPLLLLRAGEFVDPGDAGGFPLGVVGGAAYEQVSVRLEPGDRVVIYSDGIPEQTDPSGRIMYGEARMRACLGSLAEATGQRACDGAIDALARWAGARAFADDVSLVMLDWKGYGGATAPPSVG